MPSMPDAVLLCGGAGLRLRGVAGNAPKGMADIAGRPFLELLLRQLRRYGFERAIMAVGYREEVIRAHFGRRAFGLELVYSAESFPLGTGGALRNAAEKLESDSVLVMNGDSYTDADLCKFAAQHSAAQADISIIAVPADGRGDCGSVILDRHGNVSNFVEKAGPCLTAYVNAGIYMIVREMLNEIPAGMEISFERELLPRWLRTYKSITGFVCTSRCIDIGTPERYWKAQHLLAEAETKSRESQFECQL
jgi:mannose-1-phosphate guanylyltransferase